MAAQRVAGNGDQQESAIDVVVVGAGFAGLYFIERARRMGFSVVALESADDVGGTWYWNRYPGARCDIMTVDYSYSWDPELEKEWQWSEKYATQPEILRYLQYVADKYDLRRDIRFETRVEQAIWDEATSRWRVRTSAGDTINARFLVMATGCLSAPKDPDIEGAKRFQGEVYSTTRWPHEPVDFTGKRVAVIGTGSSGIQSIPIIAEQAEQLTVFQRTPNFSRPALNGPVPQEKLEKYLRDPAAYREEARWSMTGVPFEMPTVRTLDVSEEERQAKFEELWQSGDLLYPTFADIITNPAANEALCEFLRNKIRSIVHDPETAESLCPKDHYYGTKRPCLDTNYFETYNRPNVRLVDLRKTPIVSITETGIDTTAESFTFDVIVFATGFDAMTGAIVAVDFRGRDGIELRDKWAEGPKTYLGLTAVGFPNLFLVTGPGSPSVLSNMTVSIEQHVEWVTDCLAYMREHGFEAIEPTPTAEAAWVQHVNDCADITLFPRAKSWYMGANVPGKPRVFLPYIGGVGTYRKACDEVAERDYLGFELRGPTGTQCNDGVIRSVQPDVQMVLDALAELGLPPLESMSVEDARAFSVAANAARPAGPPVGEIVDGTYPGAAGPLTYRLYRPATPGPHPVVAYFHGGGWVLGSADSDDPLCRDLCVRSNAIIISADYRHAPEHRFPAPVEDAFAAAQWAADHAEELGGRSGPIAVCGWSAGANLAAVVCQLARDAGGPEIAGQVLLTPVTDCNLDTASYRDNAEGYILTRDLMVWFWDHYCDPADRSDPRASPLRAADLSNLPPALVLVCELDPLRDEGEAYAKALAAAGNEVRYRWCRGQMHTSIPMVDVVISGESHRAEMANALQSFFDVPVPA